MTSSTPQNIDDRSGRPKKPKLRDIELNPADPTLGSVMKRPRWIGMLVLALAVAAAFAWLGQWQLARAVAADPTLGAPTEIVRTPAELGDLMVPGAPLPDIAVAQKVRVSGHFDPGNAVVVGNRLHGDDLGYWVTGRFITDEPDHPVIAVARGWAPDLATARAAAESLNSFPEPPGELEGRLIPSQGPSTPDMKAEDPFLLVDMSVAQLINVWETDADSPVYLAYMVSFDTPSMLEPIDAPRPESGIEINWLNIFYAIEWAVFAGFAVFLWYRLARDAWEKEVDTNAASRGEPSPFE
ncbi:SURF1 family cytochrome oxidase biogenesis protein [Mycetocola spongiae]|uniref:SURF1 family cytochrome oxidase biogenesis protein n=1 Tax=Mycetocola spongiae TaxID=2859226 RepID=UPI001CF2349A|nr:SURF1 family cytochrome oxidase biogenesis protein [Mycetocola spongiae]UCR88645.1 SURF1 family protein [Mycetocola spongiae]